VAEEKKIYDVRNGMEFKAALEDGLSRGDIMKMSSKEYGIFLEEGQIMKNCYGFLAIEHCGLRHEGETERTFYRVADGSNFWLGNLATFYKDSPEDEIKYKDQLEVIAAELAKK
jgi:hypothetical protein